LTGAPACRRLLMGSDQGRTLAAGRRQRQGPAERQRRQRKGASL